MPLSRPLRAFAVTATLALGVSACAGGDTSTNSGAANPTGAPGGSYTAVVNEPSYLAPSQNCYESECSKILDLINDPLVTTDFESGELTFDGLAESIEPDEAQTVWTITLKEGREFHNGEPVDAGAFLRAWNYSQDPANAQSTAGFMSRIEGSGEAGEMSGLEKIDDRSFQVTLDGPFSQFGQQMSYQPAFAPIAQACLDDLKTCNELPIGTGPYQMAGEWRHDEGITLEKWADYAGEQMANADTIEFEMFTTPVAAYRDFQNGGVDVLSVSPEIYLEAKAELGERLQEAPTASLTYLGFPTGKKPYDNKLLRQAISLSIDRELIIDRVQNGPGIASTDIVTPPIPGSRGDACEFCEYDPDRARPDHDAALVRTALCRPHANERRAAGVVLPGRRELDLRRRSASGR